MAIVRWQSKTPQLNHGSWQMYNKGDSRASFGLTAQVLNRHYATVSTGSRYKMPPFKQTASFPCCFVTEMEMFRILKRLKPTATGLDGLPAWFLIFAAPLAHLILSVCSRVVPIVYACLHCSSVIISY